MKAESSRSPYYIKFHIGDYLRDAAELSLTQHGAYLRLMLWYYSTSKPIPNQPDRIYRRVGAFSAEDKGAVDFVLTEFFRLNGLAWEHKRIEQELNEWRNVSEQAKYAVTRREEKKVNKNNETAKSDDHRTIIGRSSNQNQNQNQNQEPVGSKGSVVGNPQRVGARKGSRLTPGFIPPEPWLDFCRQERPDLDPFETYNKFHDYWISVPGQMGTKIDWEATWRNWVRRENETRKVR